MPGVDGLALQGRLAELERDLPIVFVTGHGDIPMSVRAIKGGAVDFLTKPVETAAMLAAVREALATSVHGGRRTPSRRNCDSGTRA